MLHRRRKTDFAQDRVVIRDTDTAAFRTRVDCQNTHANHYAKFVEFIGKFPCPKGEGVQIVVGAVCDLSITHKSKDLVLNRSLSRRGEGPRSGGEGYRK